MVALHVMQRVQRLAHQLLAAVLTRPHPAERARELLEPPAAVRRQREHALAALGDPVATALELLRERQRRLVDVALRRVAAGRAGDDERRARLVHQHAVRLVHDAEHQTAQHHALQTGVGAGQMLELQLQPGGLATQHDPIFQIVERELLVGAVRHVAAVGGAPLRGREPVHDQPDAQPQRAVDRPHLLGVALREIVVDGDDVHGQPGQGGRGGGERRGQRLALTRLHLGDHARQQDRAADELDVEMTEPQRPAGHLAHQRERARGQLLAEALAR